MNIAKLFTYLFVVVLLTSVVFAEQDEFNLNEEYAKNLYLTNNDVNIKSNLYGDLFAVSEKVDVSALVKDDINAIAGEFNLDGTIGSDLRIISSKVTVDGTIFGETMILGNYVELSKDSAFGRVVRISGNEVIIDGTLKDDLYVAADKVVLNGVVEGDAVIKASEFELGPDAKILGDLSTTKEISDASSKVAGTITKIEGKEKPDSFTAITFGRISIFITLFLIGAVLVGCAGKFTEKSSKAVQSKFLLSLVSGFVLLVAAPFAGIFLALTFVGLPVAILLGLVYIVAIILAFGLSAVLVGKAGIKIFKGKKGIWIELLIGSLALALISIVAPVFWIFTILLVMTSIGSMFLVLVKKDKKK